jgi:hypothetical protein
VGVAGHRGVRVGGGHVQHRGAQLQDAGGEVEQRPLGPEAEVGRNLVVSATGGVELAGDRADEFAQPPLDAGVDVFVGEGQRQLVGIGLGENPPQPSSRVVASSGATIPCRPSIRAWAIEPRMSSRTRRTSKPTEALNASSRASGPAANRPPPRLFLARHPSAPRPLDPAAGHAGGRG